MADALTHMTPRLDAPDRVWLIPLPVAKWLVAGGLSGPVADTVYAALHGSSHAAAWNEPVVWLVWVVGLVLSCVGAFVRPGGVDAVRWLAVYVDYLLVPRRAVWCPV